MQLALRSALVLAISVVSFSAERASACSAPACPSVGFVPQSSPSADEVPVVPENGAVVALVAWGAPASARVVRATRVRDGLASEIDLAEQDGRVALDGAREGDVWTIRETHTCGESFESDEASTTVRIGAAAPMPHALGTLSASAPQRRSVQVPDASGPCSSGLDSVAVDLDVALDTSAEPWAELLRWETRVDGEPFAWPSSTLDAQPGGATVFVACAEPGSGQYAPDLEEGTHLVQRRAYLPGSSEPIATDEIEIELRCQASEPEPGASQAGCSVAQGARGGVGGVLVGIAALALAQRRRRRG